MLQLGLLASFLLFLLPSLFFYFSIKKSSSSSPNKFPKSYPIIGSSIAISANEKRRNQWITELLQSSPTSTFVLSRAFGEKQIFTANPCNVEHILKSHFHLYPKGDFARQNLTDFLGSSIFNADGETWKFQRPIARCSGSCCCRYWGEGGREGVGGRGREGGGGRGREFGGTTAAGEEG